MSLIDELIAKAKQNPKRIALPECEADKTLLAARRVLDEGIGVPVLVAAQQCIGMQDGVTVSSLFALAEIPGFTGSEGARLVLADCALVVDPDPSDLAGIAISTCDNVRAIMGWEPRCAFLSFSTKGSGAGASVDKIAEALRIVREKRPDLKVDGEFQLDAALKPEVAAKKVPGDSAVAGKANILIFPDLNAANIGIKMIQIFAGGSGYGHTLSGFVRPVADSSRGATVEEIVGDIAMVAIAAGE